MAIRLIDESTASASLGIADLKIEPVVQRGPLLDVSYNLLERVFDPSVIDPIEFYYEELAGQEGADSVPIFLAAYFQDGADKLVAGFNSSTLMRLQRHPDVFMLAVGNVATSPRLKEAGFRGVGTTLLNAAVEMTAAKAQELGGRLRFSITEAEPASLGFWRKRGFRWPKGIRYLQPPLDFHDDGSPVYPEVAETLLVAPCDEMQSIDPAVLRDAITTIYENWSLKLHRATLAPEAMRKAEAYVMTNVFGQVDATIAHESIPLVDVTEADPVVR
jgi:hypothetical protein